VFAPACFSGSRGWKAAGETAAGLSKAMVPARSWGDIDDKSNVKGMIKKLQTEKLEKAGYKYHQQKHFIQHSWLMKATLQYLNHTFPSPTLAMLLKILSGDLLLLLE